jgi:hypothetical protein
MSIFSIFDGSDDDDKCKGDVGPGTKDTQVQFVISMALGLSAFLSFCVGARFPAVPFE